VTHLAAYDHNLECKKAGNPDALRMDCIMPYNVVNFRSILPYGCGLLLGAVYSNLIYCFYLFFNNDCVAQDSSVVEFGTQNESQAVLVSTGTSTNNKSIRLDAKEGVSLIVEF
jgi:hypothetical protein